jgi:DNA-binding MarR family transcriptional regulator
MEDNVENREVLMRTTVQAYTELFVLIQSASVAHWLMFELTFAQARALIILAARKSLTVSQLARQLGVGNPTSSILVQQLVQRGLVTRTEDERDRRQTVVRLSQKGEELSAGHRKQREAQWMRWLSHLSDEELRSLARGLKALQEVIRAETQADLEKPGEDGSAPEVEVRGE